MAQASGQCLVTGAVFGVGCGGGRDRVVVTQQSEGVSCYDLRTQRVIRTWALGQGLDEFSAPAVLDPATRRYFAALQRDGSHSTLVSWPHATEGGTILQIAQQVALPSAATAVLPVASRRPRQPPTSTSEAERMEVDSSQQPAVFVACSNGAVALCSPSQVLSQCHEAAGLPLLAACVEDGVLLSLHLDHSSKGGAVSVGAFSAAGSALRCDFLRALARPAEALRPLSGTCTAGKAAVLWSDGSLAVYEASSSCSGGGTSSEIAPTFVRRLRGFHLPEPAPLPTPIASKSKGRASKKRGHEELQAASSSSVAVAATGGGIVAVTGWTEGGVNGSAALRLAAVEVQYGAVLAAVDLAAAGMGLGRVETGQPVQAVGLAGGSACKLAFTAGNCAGVAQLPASPPTLASLIGALDVADHSAAADTADGQLSQGACACAAAAREALHEADVAQLAAPRGGGAGGALRYSLHAAAPSAAAELLVPAAVQWQQPAAERMHEAEGAAWGALVQAAAASKGDAAAAGKGKGKGKNESKFLALLAPLLEAAALCKCHVSHDLLGKLLITAAESAHWKGVEALLSAQHPGSLAACPGAALALATAHQFPLLHSLLRGASDLDGDELAALLRTLLAAPSSPEAQRAQREYAASVRSAAEAALSAAETAPSNDKGAEELLAVAACAAGAVHGFSSQQLCLHAAVAAQHDPAVLLSALRQLPASQAVALLRYLLRWVRNYRHTLGDCHAAAPLLPALAVPSPAAVLEWTARTVDANLSRLMLRPDAAPVLGALRAEVAPQVASLQRLSRVKGAVEHLQCGAPLPASKAAAQRYTLEWLDLRIA